MNEEMGTPSASGQMRGKPTRVMASTRILLKTNEKRSAPKWLTHSDIACKPLVTLMRERPIEQGWRRGLRLTAAALQLHRLLGHELSPGEQRLLPFVRPPMRPLRDAETQVLNSLVVRRHQVMTMLVSEKNRLSAATTVAVRPRIEAHIAWLQQELRRLGRGSAANPSPESCMAGEE